MLIDHLARRGWGDAQTAAPVLQRPADEAEQAIAQLAETAQAGHDANQSASDPSSVMVPWGAQDRSGGHRTARPLLHLRQPLIREHPVAMHP